MNNFEPNCLQSNAARRFTLNMTATTVNKSKAHMRQREQRQENTGETRIIIKSKQNPQHET